MCGECYLFPWRPAFLPSSLVDQCILYYDLQGLKQSYDYNKVLKALKKGKKRVVGETEWLLPF